MKKFLILLSAFVAMAAVISCGKDGDVASGGNGGDAAPQKAKSTKVVATVVVDLNNDYFLYADYHVVIRKNNEVIYDADLAAPGANKRSNFFRNVDFEEEGTLAVNVICTPKSVEYETAIRVIREGVEVEYVVFNNNNKIVGLEIKNLDASGKQVGYDYGYTLTQENTNEGVVDDTHGYGAANNCGALNTKLDDNGKSHFENRQLTSHSYKYKIVRDEDGLTAEPDND